MGLNWHGAAQGASRGLETIIGVQGKTIDIMYDDVTRQNRERFQAEQAFLERDWKGKEAETERGWRTGEREAEQTWKAGESAEDRKVRGRELEMRQEELTNERENREAVLGIQQQRADSYQQSVQARANEQDGSEADEEEKTLAELGKIEEERAALDNNLTMSDAKRAEAYAKLDARKQRIVDYGAYGAIAYEKIETAFRGHPETERYASAYAAMDAQERSSIDKRRAELQGRGLKPASAYVKAIDEYMTKGAAPAGAGTVSDEPLKSSVGTAEEQAEEDESADNLSDALNPAGDIPSGKTQAEFIGKGAPAGAAPPAPETEAQAPDPVERIAQSVEKTQKETAEDRKSKKQERMNTVRAGVGDFIDKQVEGGKKNYVSLAKQAIQEISEDATVARKSQPVLQLKSIAPRDPRSLIQVLLNAGMSEDDVTKLLKLIYP